MRNVPQPRRSKRLSEEIANTHFERVLGNSAQLAIVFIGLVAVVAALQIAQVVFAPVFCAIVIGLMFGPIADLLEKRGVPDPVSAAVVVLGFMIVLAVALAAFAAPLADWVDKFPAIWERLQAEIANWQEPLAAIAAIQEQVKGILGGEAAVTVAVEDSTAVINVALLAPAILSQIGIFLLSLYFFLATRDNIRISVLSLCVTRRMRWRMAHVFRDVEQKVSRYLLTISTVNIGVGIVVTVMTWAVGLPTPLLWGAMAAVLNYIPFIGQAAMAAVLFLVGMATSPDITGALIPVALYFAINFVEGNFVTPNLLGRTMTINPFVIFLSLAFWIWIWGPIGGLIAVPSLLMLYSVTTHVLPMRNAVPRKLERKTEAAVVADVEAADAEPVEVPPPAPPRRSRAKAVAKAVPAK